jgi:tRNA pseudouridine13 synthase
MQHYPYGRLFEFDASSDDYQRFLDKDISVTGLLCGNKTKISSGFAREIEKSFDQKILYDGGRRYAWIFPSDLEGKYIKNDAWFEFNFFLPKGSYATVLLEEIAKKELI